MQNTHPHEAPAPRPSGAPPSAASVEPPSCPSCAESPASRAPCFTCGRIPAERRGPRALQLAAVDALSRDLASRPHLPDDLRADLIRRVDVSLKALRPAPKPVARVVAPVAVTPEVAPAAPAVALAVAWGLYHWFQGP